MLIVSIIFMKRCGIEFTIEVWVGKHVLYELPGVAEPHFMIDFRPRWHVIRIFKHMSIVRDCEVLPWDVDMLTR